MKYLRERVSYLKGLADGMNIDSETNEGKLLKAIIDVLDDMAIAVDDLEEVQEEMCEQLEEIDEELQDFIDTCCEEDCDEDCDCEDMYEDIVVCPECGDDISLDDIVLDEENKTRCPSCDAVIEVEFDDECMCCCDHDEVH